MERNGEAIEAGFFSSRFTSDHGRFTMAALPYAAIEGDLVTLHNIRNFTYRTETDFDAHYYDKPFDLRRLDSTDLITVYWMGDAIAHVMVSFGTRLPPQDAQQIFLEYVDKINDLKRQSEFYSTLTTTCTTNVVTHTRASGGKATYSWKVLINPRAHAIGNDPDFSRKIREGLPMPTKDGT